MADKSKKAEVGDIWRDADSRRKPFVDYGMPERRVRVTQLTHTHAEVVDVASGRTGRIKLGAHGNVRGYEFLERTPAESSSS